ncbi:MAG: class I SAM-dependent methyltransferase [archaeon]
MAKLKVKEIKCEICGSSEHTLYRKNSNLDIVKCKSCGLIYVNPQPTLEYLKDFYNEGEYRQERWDYVPPYIGLVKEGYKKVTKFLNENIKAKKPKLLDIGSGFTHEYNVLETQGWSVLGTELSKTFVNAAKKKGLNVVYGDMLKMKLKARDFSAIIMMAVFEHLTNPREYLNECKRILKDDGIIVIKIPNLNYTLMNSTKLSLAEQMHLFHFTPKTIKMLLEDCGFEVIKNEPVLECGSEHKAKHFAMVAWDKASWAIYKMTGIHTNLQMTVYARKNKEFNS